MERWLDSLHFVVEGEVEAKELHVELLDQYADPAFVFLTLLMVIGSAVSQVLEAQHCHHCLSDLH